MPHLQPYANPFKADCRPSPQECQFRSPRWLSWGQSTRINIISIFLIDFPIVMFALPSETDRLTEPGCPIASFWAIHPLLTEVCVRNKMASWTLRESLFFRAAKSALLNGNPSKPLP